MLLLTKIIITTDQQTKVKTDKLIKDTLTKLTIEQITEDILKKMFWLSLIAGVSIVAVLGLNGPLSEDNSPFSAKIPLTLLTSLFFGPPLGVGIHAALSVALTSLSKALCQKDKNHEHPWATSTELEQQRTQLKNILAAKNQLEKALAMCEYYGHKFVLTEYTWDKDTVLAVLNKYIYTHTSGSTHTETYYDPEYEDIDEWYQLKKGKLLTNTTIGEVITSYYPEDISLVLELLKNMETADREYVFNGLKQELQLELMPAYKLITQENH